MTVALYIVVVAAWLAWCGLMVALVVQTWQGTDFTYGARTGKRPPQGQRVHGVLLPAAVTLSLGVLVVACDELPAPGGDGVLLDAFPGWLIAGLFITIVVGGVWAVWMWFFMWPKFLVPPLARQVRGLLVPEF